MKKSSYQNVVLKSLCYFSLFFLAKGSPSSPTESTRAGYFHPSSSQRPIYTADREREHREAPSRGGGGGGPYNSNPHLIDEDPNPIEAQHGAESQERNSGFVEPIDFRSLLKDVDHTTKSLGPSGNNPLFAAASQTSFSGFPSGGGGDGGGGFLGKSSDGQKSDATGFVDPNVQFRSLFDNSRSAFAPSQFLETERIEPPKGSQTRTYPSYTYTGRNNQNQNRDGGPGTGRYRSSYRPEEDNQDEPEYNDYSDDDGPNFYGSPRPYLENNQDNGPYNRKAPKASASTESRQSSSSPANSPRCKKIEKTVDYEDSPAAVEDFPDFTDPEADYNPGGPVQGQGQQPLRYKRQPQRRHQNPNHVQKRPMTCYVCEDEHGRYAERCSSDSKGDPKKGEYFHSSSSSYSDNGGKNGNNGRNHGSQDRHRRNPSLGKGHHPLKLAPATTTISAKITVLAPKNREVSGSPEDKDNSIIRPSSPVEGAHSDSSTPKIVEKRQTPFGGGGNGNNQNQNQPQNPNERGRNPFGYEGPSTDFQLPRGYIGNNPEYNGERAGAGGNPGVSNADSSGDGGFGFGDTSSNNNNNDNEFGPPREFGRENNNNNNDDNDNDNDYNDGPGSSREYDFSIPKDYDPDVQAPDAGGGSRNSNRGSGNPNRISGGESSSDSGGGFGDDPENASPESNDNDRDNNNGVPSVFDASYNDYIKQHFPELYDDNDRGGGGGVSNSNQGGGSGGGGGGFNGFGGVGGHRRGPGQFASNNPQGGQGQGGPGPYASGPGFGASNFRPSSAPSNGPPRGPPISHSPQGPPPHGGGGGGYGPPRGPPPHRGGPPPRGAASAPPSYVPRPSFNNFNQYPSLHRANTQNNRNYAPPPPPHSRPYPPNSNTGGGGGGNQNSNSHGNSNTGFIPQGGGLGGLQDEEAVQHTQQLNNLVQHFGRDKSGCQRVRKGDMSCYVCKDHRGMNKEECMYASGNDPRNQRMAYHEVTEYSSNPPSSFAAPPPGHGGLGPGNGLTASASDIFTKTVASPNKDSEEDKPANKGRSITRVERMVISSKIHQENNSQSHLPPPPATNIEYDFDY